MVRLGPAAAGVSLAACGIAAQAAIGSSGLSLQLLLRELIACIQIRVGFVTSRMLHRWLFLPALHAAFTAVAVQDCHGNWTAAVALMDRSLLPKPPLTLTASMLVRTSYCQRPP